MGCDLQLGDKAMPIPIGDFTGYVGKADEVLSESPCAVVEEDGGERTGTPSATIEGI